MDSDQFPARHYVKLALGVAARMHVPHSPIQLGPGAVVAGGTEHGGQLVHELAHLAAVG